MAQHRTDTKANLLFQSQGKPLEVRKFVWRSPASEKRFSAAKCLDTLAGFGKVRAETATGISMNFPFSAMLKR